MAKQLYDYWFVQFDFPNEEGKPYKSSGAMAWNEKLKREIPQGWNNCFLGDYIGRTYYILEEPTNWNISETSFTLRAKENVPNDFFYGMLRSNEIQMKADKAAMGSTLRCLVLDSLCSLQYIEIPNYMIKLFAAKVSPLYRQIHRNNKEISELTKQRDEILPLLMNGQASVVNI